MKHDDAEKRPAKAINDLDGRIFGLTELVLAILGSCSREQRVTILDGFNKECAVVKAGMLNTRASDDLIAGFDEFVERINKIHGLTGQG